MTIDEQEAESRKYSNDVIILLPLTSRKCAVFNAARQLERIVDYPLSLFDLQVMSPKVPRVLVTFNPPFDDIDI